ncbi:hypothetical protein GCM10010345_69520 [Streptomyces canarius]|uniref:Uncharacterized protein n=1 Tax=Streptomyces canarius TaxID=285453 RepID=A0ABQ3D4F9_9ACTN|nr:hypothetical protein GCM10010345_69520 [Streptomyces canarius]
MASDHPARTGGVVGNGLVPTKGDDAAMDQWARYRLRLESALLPDADGGQPERVGADVPHG